jgi:hypothetical protein
MIRTYTLKPHQKQILNEVKRLPLERLHYLVVQQSRGHSNLTLNELKKHIQRGITLYIKELYGYEYKRGLEDEVIKFYCFFETSKEFFLSQHLNSVVDENIEMNLHFHLFLSGNYGVVNFTQLIQYIIRELTNQKNKPRCLKLIDYMKLESLQDDFILYHTKQMMYRPSPQMIIHNV